MSDHYVYMMTNPTHTVLYIGMTSDIARRVEEHQLKIVEGFTKKYNCTKLVYIEVAPDRNAALYREVQLKKWSRVKKAALVKIENPLWKDLSESLE